jgi:hypothetical protein
VSRRRSFSDQIRRAIEESGRTRYAIWKATGIDQAALSRFIAGNAGLSLDAIDKLADYLDLNITTTRREPQRK